jgi:hypothetical protein
MLIYWLAAIQLISNLMWTVFGWAEVDLTACPEREGEMGQVLRCSIGQLQGRGQGWSGGGYQNQNCI